MVNKVVGHKTFSNPDGSYRHEPLYQHEADAITAAIESLSRQGGDMSTKPENLDASGERVYGIDTSQVEYDRELIAKMLDELEPVVGLQYIRESVANQARLLRAADNRDAAGVRTVNIAAAPAPGGE